MVFLSRQILRSTLVSLGVNVDCPKFFKPNSFSFTKIGDWDDQDEEKANKITPLLWDPDIISTQEEVLPGPSKSFQRSSEEPRRKKRKIVEQFATNKVHQIQEL